MSILSFCPNNLCVELLTVSNSSLCRTPHCVELLTVSNSSLCPTHHCFQLVMMCYLSSCATCHRIQLVFVFNLSLCSTSQRIKFVIVPYLLWGEVPTTKKIMPPGKPQDVLCLFCSFLFFFTKHVQNRRFCAKFGQKCVLKK